MIIFKSVYKTFDPDESGVKDISFEIDPGELVMVTGHSGSGKTTLMRLLTKEYTPTEGEIHFDGTDVTKLKSSKLHEHRRKIGVVFQDYRLVPDMNVWENIALPLSILGKPQSDIEERVTDLLNLVQLAEKAHLFPSQLSGGEAQRISIARALAMAPSVIFADEPTGNLDQDTSMLIAHLLKQINDLGTTLIFATHDPKILSIFADKRHIKLRAGEIEFDTAHGKKKQSSTPNTATTPTKAETKEMQKDKEEKQEQEAVSKKSKKTSSDEALDTTQDTEAEKDEPTAKKKTVNTGFLTRFFGKKTPTKTADATKEDTKEKDASDIKEDDTATTSEEKSKDETVTKDKNDDSKKAKDKKQKNIKKKKT